MVPVCCFLSHLPAPFISDVRLHLVRTLTTRDEYELFLGEFYWSLAYRFYSHPYERTVGWQSGGPESRVPVPIMPLKETYFAEDSGFDCSMDSGCRIELPCQLLIDELKLHWSGIEGQYVNDQGEVIIMDPSVHEPGPGILLVKRDALTQFLKDKGYAILWTVLGEKQIIGGGHAHNDWQGKLTINGAFRLTASKANVAGKTTSFFESPTKKEL